MNLFIFKSVNVFQIELKLRSVGFRRDGKTTVPAGEKPHRSKDENQQQTQPAYYAKSGN